MKTCQLLIAAAVLLEGMFVAHAANGDVLISSYLFGRILRFDESSGEARGFLAGSNGGYTDFRAMAIGPEGLLYAAGWKTPEGGGYSQSNIYRFDPAKGEALGFWADYFSLDQLLAGPGGILYGLGRASSSTYLQRWDQTTGAALPSLNLPAFTNAKQFAFASNDDLIIASSNKIQRFSSIDGALVETIAELDVPTYYYTDVAIGPDGDVYATIAENSRNGSTPDDSVLRYDGVTGDLVSRLFVDQVAPRPISLAFGPDGGMYVGSRNDRTLVRLGSESNVAVWKATLPGFVTADSIVFAAGVPEPTGLALASLGGLLGGWRRKAPEVDQRRRRDAL